MQRDHYNLLPMKLRAFACTAAIVLLLGVAGRASAQAFGSVSSLPPAKPASTPVAAPVTAPVTSAPAESSGTAAPAPLPPATPTAIPSTGVSAAAAPVAGAEAASKPWKPAPFFSAPKVDAPPPAPATKPDTPTLAAANVAPASLHPSAAFSSVSSGADASSPGGGSGPALPFAGSEGSSSFEIAERIVVEKTTRRLLLVRGGDVIAAYPVRLGLNPFGHKQREGDFRTPEGSYYLSRRNPRSEFFLSLEVSYPSPTDRERARASGVRPGGLIMIHGQPNIPRKPPEYYASNDWTDGCIAVSNSDMVDIWLRTRIGTPIEIRP